jgi:hypothetical protein
MNAWSELSPACLADLQAVIAHSPIVLRGLEARLADWTHTRMAPDVDEVVLAWLASQSCRSRLRALS